MSSDFRIRGIPKPITGQFQRPLKSSQFEEVLRESEQLVSEANNQEEEVVTLNADLSYSLKSISSIYLDNNPRFQELKKTLESYHLDCRRQKPQLHPGKSSQWRQIVYASLHRLLHECVFTNIRRLQIEYLNKVYEWFYAKIGVTVEPSKPLESLPNLPSDHPDDAEDQISLSSQKRNQSAASLRPRTANTNNSKVFDSRPTSAAVKLPVQAFVGSGEPYGEIPEVDFENSFISYMPFGEEIEQKVEQRFKENRLKDLAEKRLRDEMRAKVDSWTIIRARKTEEFNRKFESNRFGSKFDKRAYSPSRPHTASEAQLSRGKVFEMQDPEGESLPPLKTEPVQTTKNEVQVETTQPLHKMSKIATIRKLHEEILEGDESFEEPNNLLDHDPTAVTLSAYSKSGQLWNREVVRPHTAGYLPPARNIASRGLAGQSRPVTAQRASQLEEINEVKKQLAKKNIPCSIDTLKYGLLMPEDLPCESLTYLTLPAPGAGLLVNPFTKLGKKGKKKGKKGKKGKKSKK
jgi:hypothetical protein